MCADPQRTVTITKHTECCGLCTFYDREVEYPTTHSILNLNYVETLVTSEHPYIEEYIDKKYRDLDIIKVSPNVNLNLFCSIIHMEIELAKQYMKCQPNHGRRTIDFQVTIESYNLIIQYQLAYYLARSLLYWHQVNIAYVIVEFCHI